MPTSPTRETTLTQPDLERRIDVAATKAAEIATTFSPAVGAAIQAGADAEPLFSGLVKLIMEIFKHHAKKAMPQAPQA